MAARVLLPWITLSICGFLSVFLIGCHRSHDWQRVYSEARLQFEQGDLSAALNKAEQGFSETSKDPVWNWKFRVLKAEILQGQTRNGDVLGLLAVPPPYELSSGEFAVRAKATEGMAHVILSKDSDDQGRLKEAEEMAVKTAPQMLCEVKLYEGNQAFGKARHAEESSNVRKEQYDLAEQRFRESLQLATQNGQHFTELGASSSLGRLSTILGRFDEAADWYSTAIKLARSSGSRLLENIALANQAWSYSQLGDFENAISTFSAVVKVIDSLDQSQLKHDVFNNMGETYFAQGNYSAAHESYLKAFAIASEMQRDNRADEKLRMVTAASNVAQVALEENNLKEADDYSHRASAIDPHYPRAVLISAKVAVAHGYMKEAKSQLKKILETRGPDKPVSWDAELASWDARDELARIFVAEHQDLRAEIEFQKVIDEIKTFVDGLHVIQNRLAFSTLAGRFYDDYVRFLVATGKEKKAFEVAELSRGRNLAEGVGLEAPARPSDINIEKIQRFLKKQNKTILAYWLAPDKSFLWLVSPAGFELFTLASGTEIEKQTREYNETLQGLEDPERLEQRGQSLYALLVQQAEKLIPHDAKLVIIPDGRLTRLNFETLRVPHPKPHFWIQDAEFETASSTNLFIRGKTHFSVDGQRVLLIGDPKQASDDYPALIHAPEELKRVKAHFASDQEIVLSREEATPSAYSSSHPERFGLIHFVTHGTASELSPLESAIVLSPQAENDFKLYARDIVKIRLNADMVTISACYGLGKRTYSGEGLVGLAWAFLRAGAHQVVAGLWEVNDRAAVDLMDDFYTELQKGQSAAAALRLAKLKMVMSDSAYRRPYYWASLQLYTGA